MNDRWRLILASLAVTVLSTAAAATFSQPKAVRDDLSEADRVRVDEVTAAPTDFTVPQAFEQMSGGAATSTKLVNANAFSHPSANLEFADQQEFLVGNGLFRKDWVSSPSSTQASDGLGPLYNARSCQSCHIKDGRGHAPTDTADEAVSLLVRLGVPPDAEETEAIADGQLLTAPDPIYGFQLQDHAVAGLRSEGRIRIDYEPVTVQLSSDEKVTLRKPVLSIEDLGYGALHPNISLSARVAPPMIGLGLLEAIHQADILATHDPDDDNADGISGRVHWTHDMDGERALGRFGWKAVAPSVREQTALAFSGDMGLSTPLAPSHWGECTDAQEKCLSLPHGAQPRFGDHEVPQDLFDRVVFYSENLAVPARRNVGDADVLAGKEVFHAAGCEACHTPSYVTSRDSVDPAHRFQLIWPYTDLLLHDMGDELADGHGEGDATGREWRTPALWGIGLTRTVNGEATYLHDGRARTLLEAVLWHGGEAEQARSRVIDMNAVERRNLIRFLESL